MSLRMKRKEMERRLEILEKENAELRTGVPGAQISELQQRIRVLERGFNIMEKDERFWRSRAFELEARLRRLT